ncbi:hypothetical protein ROTAS13_03894 [Roseomonas sp. TAS13]|nr:hypothetical protein ROTAS13_03894 [Roseomonas sp. TAS13]
MSMNDHRITRRSTLAAGLGGGLAMLPLRRALAAYPVSAA